MQPIATLHSVQVGTPHRYQDEGTWRTSFVRVPSPDRRWLAITHLEGNVQADKKNHGRPNQAVLLYAAAHYPHWQRELARPEIGPGGFGENFTLDGLSEATACLGDVYELGEARIEVTGPRFPCTKISRRWQIPELTRLVAETGRTGWYCGVQREGWIEPGLTLTLVERPYPDYTMALINDLSNGRNRDLATAEALAACPALEPFWRRLVLAGAKGRQA